MHASQAHESRQEASMTPGIRPSDKGRRVSTPLSATRHHLEATHPTFRDLCLELRVDFGQDPGLAYALTPLSYITQASSPTVQASCPGSMRKTSPAPTVASVPSSERTTIFPDTHTPVCRVIHDSVPAIGFTSFDHFQPGSKVPFPIVKSPMVITSI